MSGQADLADALPPIVNVLISNVSGPRKEKYCIDAKMLHVYPVFAIAHGLRFLYGPHLRSRDDAHIAGVTKSGSAISCRKRQIRISPEHRPLDPALKTDVRLRLFSRS
jgi:hypothetical protein